MGAIRDAANAAFRDHETSGVPSSGYHEPVKSDIRSTFGVVEDRITALEGAQRSGFVVFQTWSELAAHPTDGLAAGAGAKVYDDAGTHTDPVTDVADTPNTGVYSYVPGEGWERVAALESEDAATYAAEAEAARDEAETLTANAQPEALNVRITDFPQRSTFTAGEVTGPYGQSDGALDANPTWSINGGGELVITNNMSGSDYRYWDVGHRWRGFTSLQMSAEATLGTTTQTNGVSIGLGSAETGWVNFMYARSGAIGLFGPTGNALTGEYEIVPAMAYTAGQKARIDVLLKPDGTGTIIATHPGGATHSYDFSGIEERGIIGPSWRRNDSATINSFVVSAGADERASVLEARVGALESEVDVDASGPRLLNWGLLPDSVADRDPPGFTGTGLGKVTRGVWKGCWLIADDGRLVEGDASTMTPRVHIVSPDFRRVLLTIDPGYSGFSAQGIAVDSSGAADTFWLATGGDRRVRHYQLDGTEIAEDAVDFTDLDGSAIAGNVNGLAYDPAEDALYVTMASSTTLYKIAADPLASPRLLGSYTLPYGPDMMFWLDGKIYYTSGGNGSPGDVRSFVPATETAANEFLSIELAEAIEGIHIDADARVMTLISDGGFHTAAEPALNIWAQYRVPALT